MLPIGPTWRPVHTYARRVAELRFAFFFDAFFPLWIFICRKTADDDDDVLLLLTATYCDLIAYFLSGSFSCNNKLCHGLLN